MFELIFELHPTSHVFEDESTFYCFLFQAKKCNSQLKDIKINTDKFHKLYESGISQFILTLYKLSSILRRVVHKLNT